MVMVTMAQEEPGQGVADGIFCLPRPQRGQLDVTGPLGGAFLIPRPLAEEPHLARPSRHHRTDSEPLPGSRRGISAALLRVRRGLDDAHGLPLARAEPQRETGGHRQDVTGYPITFSCDFRYLNGTGFFDRSGFKSLIMR